MTQKKPRYTVSDSHLKNRNAIWIPGYENRYAYDAQNNTVWWVAGHDYLSAMSPVSHLTPTREGVKYNYKWIGTVNGQKVSFTTESILDLIERREVAKNPEYVNLQNDTYAVGRIIADGKNGRDRVEIVAINLDSATARDVAKNLTIKELNKFVIFSVDAIVNFKVVPEVIN